MHLRVALSPQFTRNMRSNTQHKLACLHVQLLRISQMGTIKLQSLTGFDSAVQTVMATGGGVIHVCEGGLAEMAMALSAVSAAHNAGAQVVMRSQRRGFTIELRDGGAALQRGRKPGALSERLAAMSLGEVVLVPASEVTIVSLRTMASRINAATGQAQGRLLVVNQARGAQLDHRVEAVKPRYSSPVAPAAIDHDAWGE